MTDEEKSRRPEYILNPTTGRHVLRTGVVGKKLVSLESNSQPQTSPPRVPQRGEGYKKMVMKYPGSQPAHEREKMSPIPEEEEELMGHQLRVEPITMPTMKVKGLHQYKKSTKEFEKPTELPEFEAFPQQHQLPIQFPNVDIASQLAERDIIIAKLTKEAADMKKMNEDFRLHEKTGEPAQSKEQIIQSVITDLQGIPMRYNPVVMEKIEEKQPIETGYVSGTLPFDNASMSSSSKSSEDSRFVSLEDKSVHPSGILPFDNASMSSGSSYKPELTKTQKEFQQLLLQSLPSLMQDENITKEELVNRVKKIIENHENKDINKFLSENDNPLEEPSDSSENQSLDPKQLYPEQPVDQNKPTLEPFATRTVEDKHPPKYHKEAILLYFGDLVRPDWDLELENNIFDSKIESKDRIQIMDGIISTNGPKIFVFNRVSDTLEELNEIVQLHFCLQRNMSRGYRTKNALVPISALNTMSQMLGGTSQPQGTDQQGQDSSINQEYPESASVLANEEVDPAEQTFKQQGALQPLISQGDSLQYQIDANAGREKLVTALRNRPYNLYGRPTVIPEVVKMTGMHKTNYIGPNNPKDPAGLFVKYNVRVQSEITKTKKNKLVI